MSLSRAPVTDTAPPSSPPWPASKIRVSSAGTTVLDAGSVFPSRHLPARNMRKTASPTQAAAQTIVRFKPTTSALSYGRAPRTMPEVTPALRRHRLT